MAKAFYNRLRDYFEQVGKVLSGEAEAASIFANSTDIGTSRECIYAEFLKQHVPSKCNIFLGGFLFGEDGTESKQLDVIISTDTAPRYNFHNQKGNGKSFGPVEGCLGVVSIKSKLDKKELFDALKNIASIPPTESVKEKKNPMMNISGYEDWPYKVIYASNGLNVSTIVRHMDEFYSSNPNIPVSRKPDIIHVAGKYVIFRIKKEMIMKNPADSAQIKVEEGSFQPITRNPDIQAIIWILDNLQRRASAASNIMFNYSNIINNLLDN